VWVVGKEEVETVEKKEEGVGVGGVTEADMAAEVMEVDMEMVTMEDERGVSKEVDEMEGTLEEVWVVAEELEGSTEEDTLEEYSVSVVMRVVKTVDSDMSKYSRHFWP